MKKILCYGDSNTFGYNPETGGRYDKNTRWSGILSYLLKENYQIIEEGMNNRTAFFKNPEGLKQSGSEYLSIYLQDHKNIDICILNLGTNDAQIFYPLDKVVVEKGLQNLVNVIKNINPKTKIIIVPPVKITQDLFNSGFAAMFDKNSIEKIQNVMPVFEQFARDKNYYYFDFDSLTSPSKFDGIHYTKESHQIIATKLAEYILSALI